MIGQIPIAKNEGRGTEYMAKIVMENFFHKLTNLHKYNWIVVPFLDDNQDFFVPGFKNIIWLHVPAYDMPEKFKKVLIDPSIVANTTAYIVQSQFHKADIVSHFGINPNKVFILNNTFKEVPYVEKPKSQIVNFIYATQISRGLDILLEAFSQIDDPDIRLTIHGTDCLCQNCMGSIDSALLKDSRITALGFTSKDEYINNLQKTNIFAYPCTFQETAGLAIMEAMMAGAYVITTDLGAIKETTLGYAKIIGGMPIESEKQNAIKGIMTKKFIKEMKKAIKLVRSGKLKNQRQQSEAVFNRFNIDVIEKQWQALNSYL